MRTAFAARPSRDFVPAADLLFAPPKSRQKALPCKTAPSGFPAMPESQGRAELTSLLSVQTGVASQFLKRAARAPWDSGIAGGLEGEAAEQPTQQPAAKPEIRSQRGISLSPLSTAGKRKARSPRAQRASVCARHDSQSGGASPLETRLQGSKRTARRRPRGWG